MLRRSTHFELSISMPEADGTIRIQWVNRPEKKTAKRISRGVLAYKDYQWHSFKEFSEFARPKSPEMNNVGYIPLGRL